MNHDLLQAAIDALVRSSTTPSPSPTPPPDPEPTPEPSTPTPTPSPDPSSLDDWIKYATEANDPEGFLAALSTLKLESPYQVKQTLTAINEALILHPELSDLMLPEHMGLISQAIGRVVTSTHTQAAKKATAAPKKKSARAKAAAVKSAQVDNIANKLDSILGDISF